jgi:hypothetical protein
MEISKFFLFLLAVCVVTYETIRKPHSDAEPASIKVPRQISR